VSLKDWLRKAGDAGRQRGRREASIDDLVNLGQYQEALTRLEERLRRRPGEHHARLKMAELLMRISRRSEAVEEYLLVAEGFERDGFYNKASALVTKVSRLLPNDERLAAKARRLDRIKRLDHLRKVVVESLPRDIALKVERHWLELVQGQLLSRLTEDQLRRLLPQFSLLELEENDEVVSAGVRLDQLMWIVSGEICARVILPNGSQTDIRAFGGGDLIGERALFERQEWSAIYVASKRSNVLALDRASLERAMIGEEDPRGLLEALRAEKNDEDVHQAVGKMHAMRHED
jgi:tetratricopeptide (TPR) repeat protein